MAAPRKSGPKKTRPQKAAVKTAPKKTAPLSLARWSAMSAAEQESLARDVAISVGGSFVERREEAQGDQRHHVARLEVRGVQMVLVPGGEVELGEEGEGGLDADALAEIGGVHRLRDAFGPRRGASLRPFLLEIEPRPLKKLLRDADDVGPVIETVEKGGFRLPTDDEWEHACRAGTTTTFRWGAEWPRGNAHGSKHPGPRAPNAFGLRFLRDTYQLELVDAPIGFRGGDGGTAVCGGAPDAESWLSLASAFRWPLAACEDCLPETLESAFYRRALSIP